MPKQRKRFVVFVYHDEKYYCKKSSDLGMRILGEFLGIDVHCFGAKKFISYVEPLSDFWTHSNATFIKMKSGIVSIGDLLDHDWETEDSCVTFDLPREKFIYLLEQWDALTKIKPKEIIITVDGDEVTVEGKD